MFDIKFEWKIIFKKLFFLIIETWGSNSIISMANNIYNYTPKDNTTLFKKEY